MEFLFFENFNLGGEGWRRVSRRTWGREKHDQVYLNVKIVLNNKKEETI